MKEYSYQERHLGTNTTVSVVGPKVELANQIALEAFAEIVRYENIFSRFLAMSELSILNRTGEMFVSDDFYAVLKRSYELYKITAGAFNPLVQIANYGYVADYQSLLQTKDFTPSVVSKDLSDFTLGQFTDSTKKVKLGPGQKLDFGGILKGYLAEKICSSLMEKYSDCRGIIVNLGGDLHTRGYDEKGQPFTFFIFNPVTNAEIAVSLTDTSLATSGVYARTWQTKIGMVHHILTGAGTFTSDLQGLSASIVHPNGALAEAFTKLLLQHGPPAVMTATGTGGIDCRYLLIKATGTIKTNLNLK